MLSFNRRRRDRGQARVAIVAAGVLGVLGCATLPACPAHGGPAWTALATEHFTLRTDLPDSDAREVLGELEETRAAMLAAVWRGAAGPPDRINVIALASTSELSEFSGSGIAGLWVHRAPFPATILTGGTWQPERGTILRHELGHHVSRWFLPQQPLWFAEGVAAYLETIRNDRAEQRVLVGEAAAGRVRLLRGLGLYSTARLLSGARPSPEDMAQFECTAWLLVHYLINQRSSAFEGLQRRIGAFEPARQAWAAALGDLDAERLADALNQYLASGSYTILSVKMPPWNGSVSVRTMSDAEVHGARAFMYAVGQRSRAPATLDHLRSEIGEALNADPAAIEALAVQTYEVRGQTLAERRTLAERARAAHPETELAWLMVADAADFGTARQAALVRALALAPNDAEVLARMALVKASTRSWDEAALLSRQALRLRGMSAQLLALHVASLVETGQCREAELYVGALRGGVVAPVPASTAIIEKWSTLRDRCLQVAATRASSHDQ